MIVITSAVRSMALCLLLPLVLTSAVETHSLSKQILLVVLACGTKCVSLCAKYVGKQRVKV